MTPGSRIERHQYDGPVIVLVDIELDDRSAERPATGTPISVDLRDTTQLDVDAVVLASTTCEVVGTDSVWLATAELATDVEIDVRADLTVWARVAASGEASTAVGDWITMQHVPVATTADTQRVAAPVRRVGS